MKSSMSRREPLVREWWCEKFTTGVTPSNSLHRSSTWSKEPKTSCCPVISTPNFGFILYSDHQSSRYSRFPYIVSSTASRSCPSLYTPRLVTRMSPSSASNMRAAFWMLSTHLPARSLSEPRSM